MSDTASKSGFHKKQSSITRRILLGIALGIFAGLLVGEPAGRLAFIGDLFVGLLQMTVLPFVVVSLVSNIGRFSLSEGLSLARVGALVLLLLFALSLGMLVLLPLAFPTLEAGAFFSVSMIEKRSPPDFLELYVPSNPFYALSQSLVPASVVFSILLGAALTGVERKGQLLSILDVITEALGRVNSLVVRQTPIGVFAIAASAAGTMTLSEFGRLQAYLLTHTLGSLIMVFGVLPVTVSLLTPLSYRQIMRASKVWLLTAWATGSLFAVLPMIVEAVERLVKDLDWTAKDSHATPGTLVPLGYPFPTVGKLLALVFVPFVAWFLGTPLELEQYPLFLSAGLFSSFGSLTLTIPFLLDLLQLPGDYFNLFLMAGVWSARLGDVVGGMHLLVFCLLTMAGLSGRLRLQGRRLLLAGTGLIALTGVLLGGSRILLAKSFAGSFTEHEVLRRLHHLDGEFEATLIGEPRPNTLPLGPGQNRLDRLREQGVLRVGYSPARLPFCFVNAEGELVGHDIDLIRGFAADLELQLELVPFEISHLGEHMDQDHFDIAIGGIWASLSLADAALFTEPYMLTHPGVVVPDHRRRELDTMEEIIVAGETLSFAVADDGFLRYRSERVLPKTRFVRLETEAEFFTSDGIDGLLTTAEGGSAWTLVHPEYSVVVPVGASFVIPLVIPVAGRDRELRDFLNVWLDQRRADGRLGSLHERWIEGQLRTGRRPRWCLGRDVFGWW